MKDENQKQKTPKGPQKKLGLPQGKSERENAGPFFLPTSPGTHLASLPDSPPLPARPPPPPPASSFPNTCSPEHSLGRYPTPPGRGLGSGAERTNPHAPYSVVARQR